MSGIGHCSPLHRVALTSGGLGVLHSPGPLRTLASEGAVLEKPDLIVVVQGDEIIVRTLGFHATYDKSIDQPQLIMRERASFWFASCPTQPTRGPHKQRLACL
jgi:hypothetical protein